MKAQIKQLSISTCLLLCPLALANAENKANTPQQGISGAARVDGTLDAKKTSNPTDEAVAREIRSHLSQDERLSVYAKSIDVQSKHGEVSLKGKVPTKEEKDLITRHAAMVVNPSKIKNYIKVAPM